MCGRNRDRYKMKTFYKVSDFNDRFDRIKSYFLPFSFKNVVLFCLSWMGGQMGEQMEIIATLALFCLHRYSSSILSILYLYLSFFISFIFSLYPSEIRGRIVLSTSGHEKGRCLGWERVYRGPVSQQGFPCSNALSGEQRPKFAALLRE